MERLPDSSLSTHDKVMVVIKSLFYVTDNSLHHVLMKIDDLCDDLRKIFQPLSQESLQLV